MANKQQNIKQKFKLEIQKRKKDFENNIHNLKKLQNETQIKNKKLHELIKQEESSTSKKIQDAKKEYKYKLEQQKNEIQLQMDNVKKYEIEFKETSKLELQKLNQETLNKKYKLTQDLVKAQVQNKKLLLENKNEIQRVKKEIQRTLLEQKIKYEEKKTELSKEQNIFFESLIQKKKQLEDMKKQHILDKLNLYREMKKIQKNIYTNQIKKEYTLYSQIQEEKKSLQLDIIRMQKENISYKNLIMLKEKEAKLNAIKLKNEIPNNFKTNNSPQKYNLFSDKSIKQTTFVDLDDEPNASFLVDKKILPPVIDLTNPTIKGFIVNRASKKAFKLFNKINAPVYSRSFNKLKISRQEKFLIEKVRQLKNDNSLVPVHDYIKLASFIQDKEISEEEINSIIVSTIYNMCKKRKVLSFLGGYFSVIKIKGLRKIIYFKNPKKMSRFSVINFPESEVTNEFERILAKKLNDKPFIKISENIVLTNINNEIKVITDIPFMRW